jgi:hypothetical protein
VRSREGAGRQPRVNCIELNSLNFLEDCFVPPRRRNN